MIYDLLLNSRKM